MAENEDSASKSLMYILTVLEINNFYYIDFPKCHWTATSSLNKMHISILTVRGYIKIISKWRKKLFQSEAALTTFYFKVRQVFFQSGAKFCFNVRQLFQKGAIISK